MVWLTGVAQPLSFHPPSELAAGKTYPQRGPLSDAEFDAYFLSYGASLSLLSSRSHSTCPPPSLPLALSQVVYMCVCVCVCADPASRASFAACATDLILGLLLPSSSFSSKGEGEGAPLPYQGQATTLASLSFSLADVDWSTRLAFGYYIKPNYPGRSSHLVRLLSFPLQSRLLQPC